MGWNRIKFKLKFNFLRKIFMLRNPSFKVICFVLSIVLLCQPSLAQEDKKKKQKKQPEQPSKEEVMEEVVVQGQRAGEGATGRGRNRGGRGDNMGRGDLDDFPGEDAADALDRLNSLSLGEDGQEGQSFSIGGMAAELSQITLNGQTLGASGESGGFSPGNLPSDMILSIDVIKSPTAAMEEGASGGTVNLKLRSPLDVGKRILSVTGKLSHEDLADSVNPNFSGFWSDILVEDKVGFFASLSYSKRYSRRDSIDSSGWEQVDIDLDKDGVDEFDEVWRARDFKYGFRVENKKSLGANVVLAFKPTKQMDIKITGLFSDQDKDLQSSTLKARFNRQREILDSQVENGIVTLFDSQDKKRKNLRLTSLDRQEQSQSYALSSELDWRIKRWQLSADAGFSRNVNAYDRPSISVFFDAKSNLGYDIRTNAQVPQIKLGIDLADTDLFTANRLSGRFNDIVDEGLYGQFDAAYRPQNSVFRALKMGVKLRENGRNKKVFRSRVGLNPDVSLSDFDLDFPYDDFLSSGSGGQSINWPVPDINALDQAFNGQDATLNLDRTMTFDVQEQTLGAYLQSEFRKNLGDEKNIRGNFGVRVVKTLLNLKGGQEFNNLISDVSFRRHYTDILPSASLLVRLQRGLVLHLSAARVMTRPSFTSLSPSLRLNEQQKTGTAGNPDLDPFYVNQLNLGIDFNHRKRGRVSVTFFYKDIDSFFANAKVNDIINGQEFLISRPFNGENAIIRGFEADVKQKLFFLPGRFFKRLDLSAHYSFSDSTTELLDVETGKELPLPGLAKHFIKGSLSYKRAAWSARLTYSYRSKVVRTPFGTGGLPEYTAGRGQVSLNLSYKFTKDMTLSMSGRNLTNSNQIQYAGRPERLLALRSQGRRFTLTFRLKY